VIGVCVKVPFEASEVGILVGVLVVPTVGGRDEAGKGFIVLGVQNVGTSVISFVGSGTTASVCIMTIKKIVRWRGWINHRRWCVRMAQI
jgi:hypothetical protein